MTEPAGLLDQAPLGTTVRTGEQTTYFAKEFREALARARDVQSAHFRASSVCPSLVVSVAGLVSTTSADWTGGVCGGSAGPGLAGAVSTTNSEG